MPESFQHYVSGAPTGQSTGVATIGGPGVTQLGGALYTLNADGSNNALIGGGSGVNSMPSDWAATNATTATSTSAMTLVAHTGTAFSVHVIGGGAINLIGDGATTSPINIGVAGDKVGFFAATAVIKQTITGSLSTVADAAAQAVLTSIIDALVAFGLVTDGTD